MKIFIYKEKKNWWDVEKLKAKHPSIVIPNSRWFQENEIEDGIYWINDIYSEFSSFGFTWSTKEKIKKKERKDVAHLVVLLINVNSTNNNKE